MARSSLNHYLSVMMALAMLFNFPVPIQTTTANTTWHEGSGEFGNGTMENLTLRSDKLILSSNASINGNWTLKSTGIPSPRIESAMVFDALHGKFVLFGGFDAEFLSDTWTYDLTTNLWEIQNPANSPPARCSHAMVYDSLRGEVILFGGRPYYGAYINDTWIYNLNSNNWTNMNPTTAPQARSDFSMAYDSDHDEIILFGGQSESGVLGDTWIYNISQNNWTEKNLSYSPSERRAPAMVYDDCAGKAVMFGGDSHDNMGSAVSLNDIWTYDPTANNWTHMQPQIWPPSRSSCGMAYCSESDEIIMFGGWFNQDYPYNDTWTYNLSKNCWTNQDPSSPPSRRREFTFAYDNSHKEIILFGGAGFSGVGYIFYHDTRSYKPSTNTWTNKNPMFTPPARWVHSMVYNSNHGVSVLFGGVDSDGEYFNDTWIYNLTNNEWADMRPSVSPPARYVQAMAYDSDHDEMILFGGMRYYPWCLNDTWTYNISANNWTNRNPPNPPEGIKSPVMVYDSAHGEMILFGGNETWAYNLSANNWINLHPSTSPPARNCHSMVYDTAHELVILFGGETPDQKTYMNDTWTYNFDTNTWNNMSPKISPPPKTYHAMAYDGNYGEVVLFGGFQSLNEIWTYDLSTNNWSIRLPSIAPSGRDYSAIVYDSLMGQIILFGGFNGAHGFGDTWTYSLRTYQHTGTYTSNMTDTKGSAYYGTISWNAIVPPNTSLSFQFRSAGSKENLSSKEFTGPDGSASTYYETDGQKIGSKNNGSCWFQYRVYFNTSNVNITPTLYKVTINYNLLHSLRLISPSGGELWKDIQEIAWNASDPDNDTLMFDIYLIDSLGDSTPLASNLTNMSWQWDASNTPAGKYQVQIIAHDDNHSIPLVTNATSGLITIDRPPHVDLIWPLDKSIVNDTSVRLEWIGTDPDGDSLTYTIRYSDRPFSQGNISTNTTTNEYIDITGLINTKTYYWTVNATDGWMNGTDIPADIWSYVVIIPPPNFPVRFTGTPETIAWIGQEYICNLTSKDNDSDIPIYSLISSPVNMTIDSSTGRLRWTPTSSDIGNHTITAQVTDGRGSFDNQTFTITVKTIPTLPPYAPKCSITYPANGSKVLGTIQVRGTAMNGSFPLTAIIIRIDDGNWSTAVGLENWTFSLDTLKLTRGKHSIEAKAFDANLSSETASVNFTVSNPAPGTPTGGNPWCLPAIGVAFVLGIAVAILLRKKMPMK